MLRGSLERLVLVASAERAVQLRRARRPPFQGHSWDAVPGGPVARSRKRRCMLGCDRRRSPGRTAFTGGTMNSTLRRAFLAIALLVPSTAAAQATSAIVDTAWVAEAMKRNAILWDARSAAAYKQ